MARAFVWLVVVVTAIAELVIGYIIYAAAVSSEIKLATQSMVMLVVFSVGVLGLMGVMAAIVISAWFVIWLVTSTGPCGGPVRVVWDVGGLEDNQRRMQFPQRPR